jgi:hypothetical protein
MISVHEALNLPSQPPTVLSGPSNGNGHGTAGTSKDDAIAIDDDEDDDNTVALSTPAIPPTPAPLTHLPPSTYAAPPPPDHLSPQVAAQDQACPMCSELCGLDLRTCAENHGGRKGLKDRIRKMTAQGHSSGDGITALYETYQAVSLFFIAFGRY